MTGWKTWVGAAVYAGSALLGYLETSGVCVGCGTFASLLQEIGGALFGVGIAHKIEKAAKVIASK